MKLILFLLLSLIFFSGCTQQLKPDTWVMTEARVTCMNLCNSTKSKQDLSNGPCLPDNNSDWNVNDWVCDVAHSPRQDVDDLTENQCQAFRNGQAHHFVEVDTECNLIRAV